MNAHAVAPVAGVLTILIAGGYVDPHERSAVERLTTPDAARELTAHVDGVVLAVSSCCGVFSSSRRLNG
jgi:hypothetical protein